MNYKTIDCCHSNLKELYKRELQIRGVSQTDIQLVLSLILESEMDENLSVMSNDYWIKLKEKGLLKVFDEVNKAHGIVWTHSNEPEV